METEVKRLLALAVIIGSTVVVAMAQEQYVSQLKRGSITTVDGLRALPLGGAKYAGNGFIFQYRDDPFVRYASFDGKTTYQYDTDSIPSKYMSPSKHIASFASDGASVYVLTYTRADDKKPKFARNNNKIFISRFDIKGPYISTQALDGVYDNCLQFSLAGRSNDMFVVSCMQVEKNKTEFNDPVRGWDPAPFVGLFQTNGQFLRRLELPNDITMDLTVVSDKEPSKWAYAKNKPKHSLDALTLGAAEEMILNTPLCNDLQGNMMVSRFIAFDGQTHVNQVPVVFVLDPYLNVKRVELQAPTMKYGGPLEIKLMGGMIIALYRESNDASERPRFILRVFNTNGKVVRAYSYDPFEFGVALVDWNSHRALFATQTGDPRNPTLGLIEGLE